MASSVRSDRSAPRRIAVVGGGIAGLAAAYRLFQTGHDVWVLEASEVAGGVIRTIRREGYQVESGPNTLVARDAAVPSLLDELGLSGSVVRAPEAAARRYVVKNGRMVHLPTSPRDLLSTQVFSIPGRLRILAEPLVPRKRSGSEVESVASFVRRRFGQEALRYAADPFVSGVHAGDPELLSVRHAFPLLVEMEQRHGSVLMGAARQKRDTNHSPGQRSDRTPLSFEGGMQELPKALCDRLGDRVCLGHRVVDVRPAADDRFSVHVVSAAGEGDEEYDAVVLTLPPAEAARLSIAAGSAAAELASVPTPPVAVLALGFRRDDVEHPLDGFGVLIPGGEPFDLLGALFSSTLFPGRAPEGHVLLTCFLGGRRNPDLARASESEQLSVALADLNRLLGLRGEPDFVCRYVWKRAIPQYEAEYGRLSTALDQLETHYPGLAVAGNVRRGISVGDTLLSGFEAADRVIAAFPSGKPG